MDAANAAALAAAHGSVSAVTFVTAASLLTSLDVAYGGHMGAALARMESPAIVIGVLLARRAGAARGSDADGAVLPHSREAFTNGSVLVIVGSLVISALTGERGERALEPFTSDLFQAMQCLFLLDMGPLAGRRLPDVAAMGRWLIGFGVLFPLGNAVIALAIARALARGAGNAFLFCVLCASASYIAVPAAMRLAVPQANPGLYLGCSLAVTFPFNILLGLPPYYATVRTLWS